MTKIGSIGDAYNWSIFKISEAFGIHRDSVKKKLHESNISSAALVKGNPVYALKDVGPALFGMRKETEEPGFQDPSKMEPKERKDWYQSENERVKLEEKQRTLIPVDEVVFVYSSMRKAVVQVLETLPDILERDCALSPQAVSMVQDSIDDLRHTLATKSYEACAVEFTGNEEDEATEEE